MVQTLNLRIMKLSGMILLMAIVISFASCKNPTQEQQQIAQPESIEKIDESTITYDYAVQKDLPETPNDKRLDTQPPNGMQEYQSSKQEIKTDFTRQPKMEPALPSHEVSPFAILHSGFAQPSQHFTLDNQRDTTITCAQGTVVTVNAGSFVYAQSGLPVKGEILFTVQEYYRLSDMLLAGLTTTSNGEILETGGMLYLDATSGDQPLTLRDGSSIRLEFPYEERKEGMQLFHGSWNDHGINWEVMEDPFEDEETTMIFEEVEDPAEFPGGANALFRYISRNLRYPEDAVALNIEGTVFGSFEITKTGDVKDVTIIRGVHPSIDQEVIRVLEAMPRWNPARKAGKNVASRISLPVRFVLNGAGFETSEADLTEPLTEANLGDATFGDIQRYVFSTGRLGWINVDVFILNRTPLRNLTVRVEDKIDIRMIFVLNAINSLIGGHRENDRYIFENVPQGLSAKLIAIKHKNGQFHLAIDPSVILSTTMAPRLNYQPVTMEELQRAMEIINN